MKPETVDVAVGTDTGLYQCDVYFYFILIDLLPDLYVSIAPVLESVDILNLSDHIDTESVVTVPMVQFDFGKSSFSSFASVYVVC